MVATRWLVWCLPSLVLISPCKIANATQVQQVLSTVGQSHDAPTNLVVATKPDVVTAEPGDVIEHSSAAAPSSLATGPCMSTVPYSAAPCGAVGAAGPPCVDAAGLPCASHQALYQATLAENEALIAAERATSARVVAEMRRKELE